MWTLSRSVESDGCLYSLFVSVGPNTKGEYFKKGFLGYCFDTIKILNYWTYL